MPGIKLFHEDYFYSPRFGERHKATVIRARCFRDEYISIKWLHKLRILFLSFYYPPDCQQSFRSISLVERYSVKKVLVDVLNYSKSLQIFPPRLPNN